MKDGKKIALKEGRRKFPRFSLATMLVFRIAVAVLVLSHLSVGISSSAASSRSRLRSPMPSPPAPGPRWQALVQKHGGAADPGRPWNLTALSQNAFGLTLPADVGGAPQAGAGSAGGGATGAAGATGVAGTSGARGGEIKALLSAAMATAAGATGASEPRFMSWGFPEGRTPDGAHPAGVPAGLVPGAPYNGGGGAGGASVYGYAGNPANALNAHNDWRINQDHRKSGLDPKENHQHGETDKTKNQEK